MAFWLPHEATPMKLLKGFSIDHAGTLAPSVCGDNHGLNDVDEAFVFFPELDPGLRSPTRLGFFFHEVTDVTCKQV